MAAMYADPQKTVTHVVPTIILLKSFIGEKGSKEKKLDRAQVS